jgi:D-alanyl-D-alanine carboxypeptidase/D-alanyl-D-alanine-endopeptidase (penicillin-binding protein 4)
MVLLLTGHRSLSAQATPAVEAIEQSFEKLLSAEDLSDAFWGIRVVNLETGAALFSQHQEKNFVPASNLKLFTSAAALDLLGPNFRYETSLYARGTIRGDTLIGDLIVKGSGDPSIGGRFTGGDRTRTFRQWADSLRAHGIHRITGHIIGDDRIFDQETLGTGWSWDDLTYYYAAPVSGLSYNENCIDVFIRSQQIGQRATVSWRPYNTDYVSIQNNTVTIPREASLDEGYHRRMDSNQIRLYSRVPAGRIDTESLTIHNATRYFTHVFRETLHRSGLQVDGRALDIDDTSDSLTYADDRNLRRLATYRSPPLHELVQVLNKKSQNLYADHLFKTLGVHARLPSNAGDRGTFAAGEGAVKMFLADVGIDTARVQLADGSGLSRQNLVTPLATTRLLSALWHHPVRQTTKAFTESLPLGGVDGTLEFRFVQSPARGNVRAKTGYLSNVRSLSGFVTTRDGTPLAFSIFCNNYTVDTDRVDHVQNTMVSRLTDLQFP